MGNVKTKITAKKLPPLKGQSIRLAADTLGSIMRGEVARIQDDNGVSVLDCVVPRTLADWVGTIVMFFRSVVCN